jgi:drug/metabolite transporter (DMT)-like permease
MSGNAGVLAILFFGYMFYRTWNPGRYQEDTTSEEGRDYTVMLVSMLLGVAYLVVGLRVISDRSAYATQLHDPAFISQMKFDLALCWALVGMAILGPMIFWYRLGQFHRKMHVAAALTAFACAATLHAFIGKNVAWLHAMQIAAGLVLILVVMAVLCFFRARVKPSSKEASSS